MGILDKSANSKATNPRKLNMKNVQKIVLIVVLIIISIVFVVQFLFSKGKGKEIKETEYMAENTTTNESTTLGTTNYGDTNRENIQNETVYNDADDFTYETETVEEQDPIADFIKQQEFLKVQRYYQAKTSPFKSSSPKMSSAAVNTSYSTLNTNEATGESYNYNPYDSLSGIIDQKNPNMQKEKRQWLKQAAVRNFVRKAYLTPAISRYEVKAGTFIPIIMNFELVSDIAGKVTAIVRENVYDSVTGNYLLIPMGTKLFGQFDSEVAFGQERVQVAFNRMTLPNGKSINLGTMLGAGQLGQSGMTGKIDARLGKVVGSVIIAAAVGGANGALTSNDKDEKDQSDKEKILSGAGEESGTQIVTVTNNYADKVLNVQPRITVPVGSRGTLVVTEDLILEEYNREVEYLNKYN